MVCIGGSPVCMCVMEDGLFKGLDREEKTREYSNLKSQLEKREDCGLLS